MAVVGRTAGLLLGGSLMHTPSAQSVPQSLSPGDPDREVVLQAASAPIFETFGDRVRVTVERVDRIGPWVFVKGKMRGADGGRPDFSGTAYEKPAAAGQVSSVYVALVEESYGWKLRAHAIGPSDVAWQNWPDDYAAPRELFGFRVT
ncbi:MAG: hypothetical protein ACRDQF_05240 [Thermocrispum sp.]